MMKCTRIGLAFRLLMVVSLAAIAVVVPSPAQAADDYPAKWKDKPLGHMYDDWGMATRYCTSWVAWALSSRNAYSMPFHADAGDWSAKANQLNPSVKTDNIPAVGAVAWWDRSHGGGYGHVAYVESVSSDGKKVSISEYNYDLKGNYHTREIAVGAPTGYIHFKDGGGSSGSGGGSSPPPPPTPHLFEAFHWNTNSGMTEVRQLNASSNFTAWSGGWTTPDGWHGGDTTDYGMADANGDGVQDLYVILYCCTGSGMTEVKILNGASNFTQWVGGWVTADSYHTPGTVRYAVGNFDGDTKPDVYVIPTNNTPSGKVEVKVLTGVSNFSQWAGGWVTPDGVHSGDHVAYTAGGCNANGKPNIYIIAHSHTNSGMTEVKVLNGANNFTQWVGGWVTPDGWHGGFDIDYVMPLS